MKECHPLQENVHEIYLQVNQNFKTIIEADPAITRYDTCRGLLHLLSQINTILTRVNDLPVEQRAQVFNITYNAVTYSSDIASIIKKSNYSFEVIKPLMECIMAIEGNIILQDVKYLDKRTRIYLDICQIYEENQCCQPAVSLLQSAIVKYKDLKATHEMDPPIPLYIQTILNNNIKILKIMQIKYSIQGGITSANDWKKKVDEEFGDDISLKLLSLTECLKTQTRKQSNVFQKNPHTTMSKNYKEIILQSGYDMVKPFMEILSKGLKEKKDKVEREVEFKKTENITQELINQEIKKKRQIQQKNIKQTQLKKATNHFSLQYHTEFIHYAYQMKNNKILAELLELALLRVQCRRIEVPYITDIGVLASSTPQPNIPNGYEKIAMDLNQASLKNELKKLRKKGMNQEEKEVEKEKEIKKGGKQKPAEVKNGDKEAPTQWQLQQIKHKYVFIIVKRSMSPENAIFKMDIVMGHEEEGPVGYMDTRRIIVPYIQQDMAFTESKVQQYKGAKESTHMVPYIVLHHSKQALQNDNEKKSVIIDVEPLIGKNPMLPARWGYHKIPVDLRQVPAQFIKSSAHDYVYLSYKDDESFFQNSRHIRILNALNELQLSTSSDKASNIKEEKLLELGINFDLEKLKMFFEVMEDCLEGVLGQQYYKSKIDFLTNLSFYIWVKYLRDPLIQFDYVNQMRLNEEIIDYDYCYYRQNLQYCKPIFLSAFKILNLILINNSRSDILFLSRVNIQLIKLLEQQQEYRIGGQNAKLCLQRIRVYRDEYLSKGVEGNEDKLLPFSLTCSNTLVKETIVKMKQKFKKQRNYINKRKRIKKRCEEKQTSLTDKQLEEEESQHLFYEKKDDIDEVIDKVPTHHSQLLSILMAIQLDISNLYFRVMLKNSDMVKKRELINSGSITNGIKETDLDGLASSIKQKLKLPEAKTEVKNKNNLKELQTTLINAERLPPSKPGLHRSEKMLIEESQKSPYLFSLLMTNFAAANSQNEDKKYYLKQSLKNIQKCYELEKDHCDLAIQNSIFLFSTLWDDKIQTQNSSSFITPFKELYDGTWPAESLLPQQPIIVSKSSSVIVLKHPPYQPQGKKKKIPKNMSIFGKPSANGVDVSHNCNELEGTGMKNKIDEVVKVTNLKQNNIYCFASASTNDEDELQPIGRTSKDVGTCHPLPIPMLASYLAKVSYQISEYDIAEKAATIVHNEYCERSGYQTEDERRNNIYYYKLDEKKLNSVSLLEVKAISESLYILALCERRKLEEVKTSTKKLTPIIIQDKQKLITNLLFLSTLLNPSLASPINSIPFLIPDSQILFKALSLTLIPSKWMTSKLKKLGVKIMEKVMKWGLQKNQISLARRILYRWSERKWIMLGRTIQVEQKKDGKKGGKETKEQEVKMIDKYCRMLIQKSGGVFDYFEDSAAFISEEYSDYVGMFVERAKEQISNFSQYVDNPPEEIQLMVNNLNLKLDLVEYLKDPVNSLKKIPDTSPFYLQYNCKILKKALEIVTESEYKTLQAKIDDLPLPQLSPELLLSSQIMKIMKEAVCNDIEWSPSAKGQYIILQQKTGKDLSKQIDIYTNYEIKFAELKEKIMKMDSLEDKTKDFDYLNLWISQLNYLKGVIMILNCGKFQVKNVVKGRYQKITFMNLTDLLKKWKEVEVLEKDTYTFKPQHLEKINKIMNLLSESAFSAFICQNWVKLQNIFRIVFNFITTHMLTPFCHRESSLWQNLSFFSILAILMLSDIRKNGFHSFKKRYDKKLTRTEMKIVAKKMEIEEDEGEEVEVFVPEDLDPRLDPNTTKDYWFQKEFKIDLQTISSMIAYTVQSLRIQNKYNLVINITRDFCNVTQHFYSLEFLPFMIQSQSKLRDEIQLQFDEECKKQKEITAEYNKRKTSKMRGERQQKLSNEPLPYQIQYEEKRQKIGESLKLLSNQKNNISSEMESSERIINEIKRDTSKTVIEQREQRKFMYQFGQDEEHMFKNYGEDTRLAKNRKNTIKDIIEKYKKIYNQLTSSKTSKDTLAQIQNRNDVGNLYFALGMLDDADIFWNDALATIFKTVNPIDNYVKILNEKKTYLVNIVGEKQILLALNILYKSSKFGAFKRLAIQQKSTDFACHLGAALYETNGNHPQNLVGHARYRMKKLSDEDSFSDEVTLNLGELISSLEYFTLRSIDSNKGIKCLPLLNLYEHITTDIVKNIEYSMRSKILKAIALTESGLIGDGIFFLAKAYSEKDLPNVWIDPSDNMEKDKGKNWFLEQCSFDTGKSWQQNKDSIEFVKKLNLKPEFTLNYGLINPILFNYAKALILFKIHETEIHANFQANETRIQAIQESQNMLRDCLKKVSFLQEHYEHLETVEAARIKHKQNEVNEEFQKQYKQGQKIMLEHLKSNGTEDLLLKTYEEEKSTINKKIFRIQLMARIRFTIHNSHLSRRLYSNSYHVLKNGLQNLSRYAFGARKVQLGQDSQIGGVQQQQVGKKEEKKGGKKEEQKVSFVKVEIDQEKEKELRMIAEKSSSRMAINSFWCLKMEYEIGKLMYHQNRFDSSIAVFTQLIKECSEFGEEYYRLFAFTYIQRCLIRLGKFEREQIANLIKEAENKYFQGKEYVDLVMDFGELLNGKESLQYYKKGRDVSELLWAQMGMKSILNGIGAESPQRVYSGKDELLPEQKQFIQRKGKKGDKKGGKEEKKGAKKEDPKKKKQDNKEQYKVKPLTNFQWSNLLDEEKQSFENYVLKPHPNFRSNNIYVSHPLNYIKCYIRYIEGWIQYMFDEELIKQISWIEKLLVVAESYPNLTHYFQVHLYNILGEINKKVFLEKLENLLKEEKEEKINRPFEDLPLNSELTKLPPYFNFILTNRKFLLEGQKYFHKAVALLKNNSLLFENGFKLEDLLWRVAQTERYLIEYRSRLVPKYCQVEISESNQEEEKLEYMNTIGSMFHHLQMGIKIGNIVEEMSISYCELGSKPLEPNAKIDQDVINEIIEIDKEFKCKYPKFLADSLKEKSSITSIQLLAYMIKIFREVEYCTFSNSHLQNLIFKCHRILLNGLTSYKEKCILSSTEFSQKKSSEDKFVDKETFTIKSLSPSHSDYYYFLYVLGPLQDNEQPYFGKLNFHRTELSAVTEELYNIRSKMGISEKKSEAVKNRDFSIYRKQLDKVLLKIGKRFDPKLSSISEIIIQLKAENLTILIRMLQNSGIKSTNRQVTRYLRYLHELKYGEK